jgi:protein SCO1/2
VKARVVSVLVVVLALAPLTVPVWGQSLTPTANTPSQTVNSVGFDQNLGKQLPLATRFVDDDGREIALAELFGNRPVILVPGYYGCPLLCSQVLNNLVRTFRGMNETAGKDFTVVAYSINPEEKAELASRKKAAYLERYGRSEGASGWHFLTGTADSIEVLSKALGFRYTYDPVKKVYSHAAGIVFATPDGRLSRYYYGLDYPVRDVEHELTESRKGRIGTPLRRLLLLCYDYDAATGKYTLSILRVMRLLGSLTAVSLLGYISFMFLRDRRTAARPGGKFPTAPAGEPDQPGGEDRESDRDQNA